ncbi:Multidrug resistance efflux transporter EmrE [Glarea lozoyensis ATCC 20868]|uniref:Multidrug resistance efflux transporter EmrE n=1 Tax=Glarea lozoyensis (strain ATCC 20868 / MF5171) TaxID=1116229 RepID=S3DG72_GLAL2|nr:Multidrug resistance efflux transporter EmrE [Glarea lozoyensis ATCC 20868]EPE31011.1 Multidrug resistance efflux transporter EmrE [Glarea lozoyensis ATCC 20868]
MDARALAAAHELIARHEELVARNGISVGGEGNRSPVFRTVGIILAIASGVFIGISFVLKKVGLLKANDKYQEVAGEGYGYLKNAYWWTGMTLMIIGEICNFVAYAFVDAILVTPMGALSVVITAVLSAIFLKERLSMVGKVGCFLAIVGSVIIVLNAPKSSSAATIQDMQHFVISPGFLSYAGVVIAGCTFTIFWVAPRYGKKSMLVYISVCSLIGGLSVVATQGLGAAIVSQIGGTKQYDQWFLYVLFVFVVCTLLVEIVYLNKALNLFNAALVTPTYYVFFTSSTIITSAILFRGFKGTVTSIVTMVLGFLTICAGVVLLQLSKSAKDVPDTAVFAGNLDQVRTIAEQEQPETEPKADAIRGAAAIVRRFSTARTKMELQEAKRLHEEKTAHDLDPIGEDGQAQWEFDGLRRRRTTFGTMPGSLRSRGTSTPFPAFTEPPMPNTPAPTSTPVNPQYTPKHPPLGMSRFPDSDDEEEDRPITRGSSVFGRAMSVMVPGRGRSVLGSNVSNAQSPMHPVPLTTISIPSYKGDDPSSASHAYYGHDTAYKGAGGERHVTIVDDPVRTGSRGSSLHPAPTPPPHSARRQFSFQHMFRRGQTDSQPHGDEPAPPSRSPMIRKGMGQRKTSVGSHTKGATEEERLGLVKGDTRTDPPLPPYVEGGETSEEDWSNESKQSDSLAPHDPRDLNPTYRREGREPEKQIEAGPRESSEDYYRKQKRRWEGKDGDLERGESESPPRRKRGDDKGAFI